MGIKFTRYRKTTFLDLWYEILNGKLNLYGRTNFKEDEYFLKFLSQIELKHFELKHLKRSNLEKEIERALDKTKDSRLKKASFVIYSVRRLDINNEDIVIGIYPTQSRKIGS